MRLRLGPAGQHAQQEDARRHQRQRVGEHADAARKRGEVRAAACQQHQTDHREAHGEQERRLAPRQIHDHDDGERPGGCPRGDSPAVAQVEVEQHRQRPAGEHGDDDAGHELREPVVDEAVGEGPVGPSVPVVVPQHRLTVAKEGDLVEVSGVVAAGDAEEVHRQGGEGQRRDGAGEEPDQGAAGGQRGRPAGRAGRRPGSSRARLPRLHRRDEARRERGAARAATPRTWWRDSRAGRSPRPRPARLRRSPRRRRLLFEQQVVLVEQVVDHAVSAVEWDCRARPARARSGDARTTRAVRPPRPARRSTGGRRRRLSASASSSSRAAAAHGQGGQARRDGARQGGLERSVGGEAGQPASRRGRRTAAGRTRLAAAASRARRIERRRCAAPMASSRSTFSGAKGSSGGPAATARVSPAAARSGASSRLGRDGTNPRRGGGRDQAVGVQERRRLGAHPLRRRGIAAAAAARRRGRRRRPRARGGSHPRTGRAGSASSTARSSGTRASPRADDDDAGDLGLPARSRTPRAAAAAVAPRSRRVQHEHQRSVEARGEVDCS